MCARESPRRHESTCLTRLYARVLCGLGVRAVRGWLTARVSRVWWRRDITHGALAVATHVHAPSEQAFGGIPLDVTPHLQRSDTPCPVVSASPPGSYSQLLLR